MRDVLLLILAFLIICETRGDEARVRVTTTRLEYAHGVKQPVHDVPVVSVKREQEYEVQIRFEGGATDKQDPPGQSRRILIYERAGDNPSCTEARCWRMLETITSTKESPPGGFKVMITPGAEEILVAGWHASSGKDEGGVPTGAQFSIRDGAVVIVLRSPHGDTVVTIKPHGNAHDW